MIRHGEELVIRGEGMPIRSVGRKGDLYVKFEVEMPGESWASRQDIVGGVSHLLPSRSFLSPCSCWGDADQV